MNKGVILRIDRKWAYLFSTGCELVKVRIQPGWKVGQEVPIKDHSGNLKPERIFSPPMRHYRWATTMIAGALIVLVGAGLFVGRAMLDPIAVPTPTNGQANVTSTPTSSASLSQASKNLSTAIDSLMEDMTLGMSKDATTLDVDSIASETPAPIDASPLLATVGSIEKDLSTPIPTVGS